MTALGLGRMCWPDLVDRQKDLLLVIPIGSTEQHGPHLPLDTDTRIAEALAKELATRRDDAVVAPALAYGASGAHAGFPGTLSIGPWALEHLVLELVRTAGDWSFVVFVSVHGGNAAPLDRAVKRLRAEGRLAMVWTTKLIDADAHAGRTETALMLALAPELVRLDRAEAGDRRPLGELLPMLQALGVREVAPNGVLGDPTGATAAEGLALFERLTKKLTWSVEAAKDRLPLPFDYECQ